MSVLMDRMLLAPTREHHQPARVTLTVPNGLGRPTVTGSARLLPNGWVEVYDDAPVEPCERLMGERDADWQDRLHRHNRAVVAYYETRYSCYPPHQVRRVEFLRTGEGPFEPESEVTR